MPIVQRCSQYAIGAYCLLDSRYVVRDRYHGCVVKVFPQREWEITGHAIVKTEHGYQTVACIAEHSMVDASSDTHNLQIESSEGAQSVEHAAPDDQYLVEYGIQRHLFFMMNSLLRDSIQQQIVRQLLSSKSFKSEYRAACASAIRQWVDDGMQTAFPLDQYHFRRLGYYAIKKSKYPRS